MASSSKFILISNVFIRIIDRRSSYPHCMLRVKNLIRLIIMVMKELLSNGEIDIHL